MDDTFEKYVEWKDENERSLIEEFVEAYDDMFEEYCRSIYEGVKQDE